MRLVNVRSLNELFGFEGNDWLEMEDGEEISKCPPPSNDIGGADSFWNVSTPEQRERHRQSCSDAFTRMNEAQWRELIAHRLKGNKQKQEITLDSITFQSKNQAARYAMETYGVSRNTAIRYIDEGRDFSNKKRTQMTYGGSYTGAKYD